MSATDILKKFRGNDSPEKPSMDGGDKQPSMTRMFKLTDEEKKMADSYQQEPGGDVKLEVTGRLGHDGQFTVMSVSWPGMDSMKDEGGISPEEVMGKMPMMRASTQPSPS